MTGNELSRTSFVALCALWALCMIPVAVVVATPMSSGGQAVFGVAALALVALFKPWTATLPVRFLMLATASLVVLRYWFWRLTETLPEPGPTVAFAAGAALLAVETYSILVFFLNAFITADPTDRKLPRAAPPDDLPTVDILVPTYNEPVEMLAVTLSAARNMLYPRGKRTVVLCDDGGTDQRCDSSDPETARKARERRRALQALCDELGVRYVTRARNEHAKAGNLSAALGHVDGELVVVFDADHVPSRDFLLRTVGYFADDPKLFLVQTPHFFINPDPVQRNLGFADRCPAESEMFYGMIHRGLDRWGGAFFCGSAAVLRRSALDSVGGFSGETITEDAETALEIHSRGWRSLYLDRAMIAGLQPETFASFIQQRGRWASGMIQMLLLKNPLFRPGLGLRRRLCYVNSMSFWLFPIVRIAYIAAPLIYLFSGVEIYVTGLDDALAYMGPYLAVSFLVQNALFAPYRWPLVSEVYEIAQAPYLARAVLSVIVRPRGASFKVTAKDETLEESYVSPVHGPLLLLASLTFAGVLALVARWIAFPGDREVLTVVGPWAILNFLLTTLALRAVCERRQRRVAPRTALRAPVSLRLAGDPDGPPDASTLDVSTGGVRFVVPAAVARRLSGRLVPGARVLFRPRLTETPDLERDIPCVVRSVQAEADGLVVGASLPTDLGLAERETMTTLIFGDSEQWLAVRKGSRRDIGLIAGLGYVLWLSVRSLPRTVGDFLREPKRRAAAELRASKKESVHLLSFGADFDADLEADRDGRRRAALGAAAAAELAS
jgi:cellulose synthase (UDP-forming)